MSLNIIGNNLKEDPVITYVTGELVVTTEELEVALEIEMREKSVFPPPFSPSLYFQLTRDNVVVFLTKFYNILTLKTSTVSKAGTKELSETQ
jgi:hypothetical protein